MPGQVDFSEHFIQLYTALPDDEQDLIDDFVEHFKIHGLLKFRGKVGPTDAVPQSDPDRVRKIRFAQINKLWHVHIGHPRWNTCKNPLASYNTSDFVVHFQRFSSSHIALVDYSSHNPMRQPDGKWLFRQR
ncbi:hypothetical protein I5L59_10755 [Pseudomonas moraviensis]|jgi:hypothetical protein|uniref:hypothetical protein n=1 Tax=Pseudomonas moraviensis TaxID=321662 RepID=UPI0018D85BC8|nr:hypothetical protein [Pseudomonas moraviensis]MBH3444054.1 hypothetical protein [Pseudomonas moraviensis]